MPKNVMRDHGDPSLQHARYEATPGAYVLNIRKMLDCSTGHLDAPSKLYLDNAAGEEGSFMSGAYGWLAPVYGETVDELDAYAGDHHLPATLLGVLRRARDLECDWVLFDADAPYDETLPTFDNEGTETPCLTDETPVEF